MRRLTALVVLVVAVAAAARPQAATTPRGAVLAVMAKGRAALLAGDGRRACALLTRHGRRRALEFRVDYDHGGAIRSDDPRLPQTCEAIVRRKYADAKRAGGNDDWTSDLRRSRFEAVRVRGARATVRLRVLKPYGPRVRFSLARTAQGWRIDDSDAVPSGH